MNPLLYQPIYLTIITLLTIGCIIRYASYPSSRITSLYVAKTSNGSIVLTIFLILFIGLRPISGIFVDMANYSLSYQFNQGNIFNFDWNAKNLIFDNLFNWMSCVNIPIQFFFLTIATIYFGGIFIACRKLFPHDYLYAILIYCAAFSTFSYGTNGIKAGAAASLFLIAIAYRKQWKIALLFLLLSYGFHHSMHLPIAAYIITVLFKRPQYYLVLWIICFLLAAAHITFFQELFANMTDEQGAGYLQTQGTNWGGKEGFRLDFLIYSAIPVIIGYYIIIKHHIQSNQYNFIYNIYLLVNSVWMLCMYANFTNRIAYLSWFMLPIVLIYPFMNEQIDRNQYKTLNYIAFGHLAFTLFMAIIYY